MLMYKFSFMRNLIIKRLIFFLFKNTTQLPNISSLTSTKNSTYVKTFRPNHINPKSPKNKLAT